MVTKFKGDTTKNARIKIDYQGVKPKVTFSYPDRKNQERFSMIGTVFMGWGIIWIFIVLGFGIDEKFFQDNKGEKIDFSDYYQCADYYLDRCENLEGKSSLENLKDDIFEDFDLTMLFLILSLFIPFILIYFPFRKKIWRWKKKMSKKRKCNRCQKELNTKNLVKNKKDGKEYCAHCIKKFRKMINLGFSDRKHPPKHVVEGQKNYHKPKPKRKPFVKVLVKKIIAPIIPGAVKKEKRNFLFLYLKREEREVLYKKYTKELNLSPEAARQKIDEIVQRLKDLIKQLKKEKKPESEINRIFKEEFAKLISKE